MRLYCLFFLLIAFGCTRTEKNDHLMCFQTVYLGERDDSKKQLNLAAATKEDLKVTYVDDLIIASKVVEVNACGKYDGALEMRQDTIVLTYKLLTDELCDSQSFERFSYVIANPDNKKFKIYLKHL